MRRDPFEMLVRSHRRLEEELQALMIDPTPGQAESTLGFFDRAVRRHEDDEEQSLFPRVAKGELAEVVETLARQHDEQAELVELLRAAGNAEAIERAAAALQAAYARHIAIEERELFPTARQVLDDGEIAQMAAEMEARRGR